MKLGKLCCIVFREPNSCSQVSKDQPYFHVPYPKISYKYCLIIIMNGTTVADIATESTSVASYLDLLFTRDRSNNITTKLYDKRDAFGFHIVNFPFMSSNIPSASAYGVYVSQLVRYARCCSSYSDFLIRHRALVKRLLSQGYKVNRLSNTFKKFYDRHTDLVGQYKKNVCQMFADSIS